MPAVSAVIDECVCTKIGPETKYIQNVQYSRQTLCRQVFRGKDCVSLGHVSLPINVFTITCWGKEYRTWQLESVCTTMQQLGNARIKFYLIITNAVRMFFYPLLLNLKWYRQTFRCYFSLIAVFSVFVHVSWSINLVRVQYPVTIQC